MGLEQIIPQVRLDVAERMSRGPAYDDCAPSDRSLRVALSGNRTGFVLECKKASPSQGLIRPNFDPVTIAAVYGAHADAISVLTNQRFFQGTHDDLAAVRTSVSVPVLCKDFVIDPWQVREARAHGADAILLMLSVLDDETYRACATEARRLSVDVLTEIHSGDELDRALALEAQIIGINNRDLRTFVVDRIVTAQLAPRVPTDCIVVCESGIESHQDVLAVRDHCDAFLVGTSLMREPALGHAVARLIYGVTKVCGLTRGVDAQMAASAGATHGGMVFAAESPRAITLPEASAVRAAAGLNWVGVFVNAPPSEIVDTVRALDLRAVQLHGEEDRRTVRSLRDRLPAHTEVWKAIRVRDAIRSLAQTGADRLVLDTYHHSARGGTGHTFDWELARTFPDRDQSLLSGGLTPALAAQADGVGTWGLDVNSGVESAPRRKDPSKLAAFFAARRGSGRRVMEPL